MLQFSLSLCSVMVSSDNLVTNSEWDKFDCGSRLRHCSGRAGKGSIVKLNRMKRRMVHKLIVGLALLPTFSVASTSDLYYSHRKEIKLRVQVLQFLQSELSNKYVK